MNEKRINITGDGSGFRQEFEKLSTDAQEAFRKMKADGENIGQDGLKSFKEEINRIKTDSREIFSAMVEDSKELNLSFTQRLDYLKQEISLLQEASRLENQRSSSEANFSIQSSRAAFSSGSISLAELTEAEDDYKRTSSQLGADKAADQIRTQELEDLFREYSNNDPGDPSGGGRGAGLGGYGAGAGAYAAGQAYGGVQGASSAFGLGALTSLSAGTIIAYLLSSAEGLERAQGSLSGITAQDRVNLTGGRSGINYGLNDTEFLEYTKQLALSRGDISNLGQLATQNLAIERTFGLSQGFLNPLNRAGRLTGGEFVGNSNDSFYNPQMTGEQALVEMIETFRRAEVFNLEKGDFTLVGEKIGDLTSLIQLASTQMLDVNTSQVNQVMGSLGMLGGSFGDQRQVQTIQRMNRAITNPGNDFTQAALFRALRMENPEASMFDLMQRQEEGIFGEGNLSSFMNLLTSGGQRADESTFFNVSRALGLNLGEARRFSEAFVGNDEFREALGGIDVSDIFDPSSDRNFDTIMEDIMRRGTAAPGTIQKFSAEVESRAARMGGDMTPSVEPLMRIGLETLSVVSSGITKAFTVGTDIFVSAVGPLFDIGPKAKGGPTGSMDNTEVLLQIRDEIRKGRSLNPGGVEFYDQTKTVVG